MSKVQLRAENNRFGLSEAIRNFWVVTVEFGVTKEDILRTDFWAHVATKLRPYDRIEVRNDEGTFFAEYLVLACDRTWAKVFELSFIDLTKANIPSVESKLDYEVKWMGPALRFCVIRKSDQAMVNKNCTTKDEANLWLANHIKAQAA